MTRRKHDGGLLGGERGGGPPDEGTGCSRSLAGPAIIAELEAFVQDKMGR